MKRETLSLSQIVIL